MWQRKDVGNHRKEVGHFKVMKAEKACPTCNSLNELALQYIWTTFVSVEKLTCILMKPQEQKSICVEIMS